VGTKVEVYGGVYGPFGNGFRVLRLGDRGSDVYEVQRKLKEKGYFKGEVDGIYGTTMQSAVHKFQRNNEMNVSNYITQSFYSKLGISLIDYKTSASW
jgi:peptidoglycan hydrolase-like protein with peptidoglycan-binding domain